MKQALELLQLVKGTSQDKVTRPDHGKIRSTHPVPVVSMGISQLWTITLDQVSVTDSTTMTPCVIFHLAESSQRIRIHA